ncbi:hypothetical protein MSAN_01899800 [Mycena sanguinolenta]|uniref:Uncharacterized protein n=1 Tax=Mycena sanguinolenta TaxID=230812 RepID=A0A8H6XRN7_9AGAR|nr:hypothetical protein MSAN_01899800 [Mycena sanguinolenta]
MLPDFVAPGILTIHLISHSCTKLTRSVIHLSNLSLEYKRVCIPSLSPHSVVLTLSSPFSPRYLVYPLLLQQFEKLLNLKWITLLVQKMWLMPRIRLDIVKTLYCFPLAIVQAESSTITQ